MEKKEKTSPFQDGKLFDPAGLLGASPFSPGLSALPFAHLAHLPGAFSMLGHPAFPVTSLFGRLGDSLTNPLGIPASLSSSLSPTSGPLSYNFDSILNPLLLSMGQLGSNMDPVGIPIASTSLAEISAKYGLFNSGIASTSSVSSPKNSSSHMTTASSTSPPTPTSSRGRGRGRGGGGRGSRGGGGRGSRGGGRGSRGGGLGSRGGSLLGGRGRPKKLIKQPAIPMSLVQSNSILSPSLLEKYARKRESNGLNGLDSDTDRHSGPSLFDLFPGDKNMARDQKHSPKSESSPGHSRRRSPKLMTHSRSPDKVHIDSLKKKLIADQIRQKMLNKLDSEGPEPSKSLESPNDSGKKQRGNKHERSESDDVDELSTEIESEALQSEALLAEKRKQERIKRSLELELKQQQIALKLMQEASANKKKQTNVPTAHNADTSETNGTVEAEKNGDVSDVTQDKVEEEEESMETDKSEASTNKAEEEDDVIKDSNNSVANSNNSSSEDSNETGEGSSSSSDSSSSGSGSSSSSSSSESETETSIASENEATDETKTKPDCKRKLELSNESDTERPIKRRHVVLDDKKIRVPLEKGWKRQTNIHTYGRRGIVGEVWYFAPCGRKMKTIPDVMRYIERNCVTDLGRDFFSFNTKVNVGEFYEAQPGSENGFVKLTESEIQDRLSVTVSRRMKKIESQKKREKEKRQTSMARQMLETKMKERMEQQDMVRKAAEMQFQKRLEREQQKELLKRAKNMKLLEKQKQKDDVRLIREHERIQKEEHMRMKRDFRAQQILEKQNRRLERQKQRKVLKSLKQSETDIIWHHLEQEREMKRQQAEMLKEQIRMKQDQERRRQHIMLLKALEQRKKQEEKERLRQEKFAEKLLFKERKNEQRRMEFVLAQELKKPMEDMELLDSKAIPEFDRIAGSLLEGEPFANCLMTLEFLHNFAKVLGFDKDSLPTLKTLQDSVLCKTEDDGDEYLSLVMHLLQYALDDPGVPNPKEAVTKLGQKITDIELTDGILSEILRVFMVVRNGGETPLSEYLRSYPLEACSVYQRSEVLAFLCNELNCSRTITSEIEGSLDKIAEIRKDKWIIEGKLRRLRTLRAKKFYRYIPKVSVDAEGDDSLSMMTSISKHSDDEDENVSGNDEDAFDIEARDDDPWTFEDCEKQMEKYTRQQANHRDKMFDAAHHVRAIDLGQDRYKRNYWILPVAGGVYVEGLESGEAKDVSKYIKNDKVESKSVKIEVISEKTERKGVVLLEEIEEKKADHILKEDDVKKTVSKSPKAKDVKDEKEEEIDKKEIKCENGFVKTEKEVLNSASEEVKTDQKESAVKKEREETQTLESVCNGDEAKDIKLKESENSLSKVVKGEICGEKEKETNQEVKEINVVESHSETVSGKQETVKSPSKLVELKIPTIKSSAIESESTNLFLQVPTSTRLSEFCNISSTDSSTEITQNSSLFSMPTSSVVSNTSSTHHVTKSANHSLSLSSGALPPPAHSNKKTSDRKPSFMSIDSILEKKTGSSQNNNSSVQTSVLPVNPFTSPHSKTLSDSHVTDTKPWFSILPRVPCDDMSLTRSQQCGLSSSMILSPPFMSQLPFHPFPLQSPTFASFQMGQLYNASLSLPLSITNTLTTSSTASSMSILPDQDSFKRPDIPVPQASGPDPLDVLKTLQGELKPIPEEYKKGWWRIFDPDKLHSLQEGLHPRGVREKNLSKTIQKFQVYANNSCYKGKKELISLECSDDEEEEEEEEVNDENKEEEEDEDCMKSDEEQKMEMEEQNTSDTKIDQDNIKCEESETETESDRNNADENTRKNKSKKKGKKSKEKQGKNNSDKMDQQDTIGNIEAEGEEINKEGENVEGVEEKMDDKKTTAEEGVKEETQDEKDEEKKNKQKPVPEIDCKAKSDEADRIALGEVEALEEKVSNASLQRKGWKLEPKTYHDDSEVNLIDRGMPKKDENDITPVECAKERLLQLESNIERRYLKPPLSKVQKINLSHKNTSYHDTSEDNEEPEFGNLPQGLQNWRIAVSSANSPAQLMLCVMQLNNCISWEKSIMKVLCQICRKDDNEAELLLCDGCDRGYHTYCFKPKMETVPDGDWYCFECVSKAAGESCCLVCGRKLGKMAECHTCNRCVHIDCLDPPLPRLPRKWFCTSCEDKRKGSKKRQRKASTASNTPTPTPTPTLVPTPSTTAPTAPVAAPIPTPDLTPTGRKRRSDYGIPRKHKTSETVSECDSPRKKKENSPAVNGKNVVDTGNEKNEKSDVKSEKEKLKICEESTDLAVCRTILTEMMKHEDGWPFLQPVNCKHFPSYRKYIKQPMDFGTMKIKLRDHVYTKRSEFVYDAYLVFDNCKMFNEDDSEVGQCGHNMRKFVTKRWKELLQDELSKV